MGTASDTVTAAVSSSSSKLSTSAVASVPSFHAMGASAIPIIIFSVFWGIVGIICPFLVPKNPNRGVAQVTLILTAACCWIFWLCCYMAQMNPLIGPVLPQKALFAIQTYWSGWEVSGVTS